MNRPEVTLTLKSRVKDPIRDHNAEPLMAFYRRTRTQLSEWLVKPVWSGLDTAMLCSGYMPVVAYTCDQYLALSVEDQLRCVVPIDAEGYVQSVKHENLIKNVQLLRSHASSSPKEMVATMSLKLTKKFNNTVEVEVRNKRSSVEKKPSHQIELAKFVDYDEYPWFFIVGNAVGLNLPSIVPFQLLNYVVDLLETAGDLRLLGLLLEEPGRTNL